MLNQILNNRLNLVIILLFHVSFSQILKEKSIFLVNSKQLTTLLNKNPVFFVLFTREDCHYCDFAWTQFLEASNMISSGSPGFKGAPCAHYNSSKDTQVDDKWKINGYPTIRLYTNGSYLDYQDDYDHEKLQQFVQQRMNLYIMDITTQYDLESYHTDYNTTVLFIYTKQVKQEKELIASDIPWIQEYKSVAQRFFPVKNSVLFRKTSLEEKVRQRFNVPQDVQLVVWTNRGKQIHFFKEELNSERFYKFVLDLSQRHLHEFNTQLVDFLFVEESKRIPSLFIITEKFLQEQFSLQLIDLARQYQNRINFVHVHYQEKDALINRLFDYLNINDTIFPKIAIYDFIDSQKKYNQAIQLEVKDIEDYLQNYILGKLSPNYKSQEIPLKDNNDSLIRQLVGKSAQSIIQSSITPIVLNLYAPWCNQSKLFNPIYRELSQMYKDQITFAEMDASENESEGLYSEFLPALKLFNFEKKVINYEGDFTLQDVAQFLNQHLKLNNKPEHGDL